MLRQLAFSPPFPQFPALVWALLQVVAVIHAYVHPTARVHPILLHHPRTHQLLLGSNSVIASMPSFLLHSPLVVSSYISVVFIDALYMELKILLLPSLDPLRPDWVLWMSSSFPLGMTCVCVLPMWQCLMDWFIGNALVVQTLTNRLLRGCWKQPSTQKGLKVSESLCRKTRLTRWGQSISIRRSEYIQNLWTTTNIYLVREHAWYQLWVRMRLDTWNTTVPLGLLRNPTHGCGWVPWWSPKISRSGSSLLFTSHDVLGLPIPWLDWHAI